MIGNMFFNYNEKGKKGQFFVISSMFLLLLLLFIYSQETQNTYIVEVSNINLVENVIYETCYIGTISNGSFIDDRYNWFKGNVSSYCLDMGFNCILLIENNTQIPPLGNYSLLNYTHYNYRIMFSDSYINYSKNFTC